MSEINASTLLKFQLNGHLGAQMLNTCKGGNATSVGWQVTLCVPVWHFSSRSDVARQTANCYIRILHFT